jgi:leucyl/phenylalanyl-tRNA--protein transferase
MTERKKKEQLDVEFLLMAYRHGYFPMADSRTGIISWYAPDPRAVIPLDAFKISRSLSQVVSKNAFDTRFDTAFEQVIRFCAEREETWISDEIVETYTKLHYLGYTHCVESWHKGVLVGGLYGVAIGGAFFGESMFSRMPNASKVALVHLVERLRSWGFRLLDMQFMNDHVRQFGAVEIPRATYLSILANALTVDSSVQQWSSPK